MILPAKPHHLDLLHRWVRYSARFNLSQILIAHNIHKIAIYGGDVIGIALYENLCEAVTIKYIIDRNPSLSFPYDVKHIFPSETELLSDLDAVIITIDFYNIEERLKDYVKCISLSDLLIDVDDYSLFEKAVRHITESNATLLLADFTKPLYYIKNPSFHEQIAKYNIINLLDLRGTKELINYYNDLDVCSPEYCEELAFSMVTYFANRIKQQGVIYLRDGNTEYFNVTNNCRLTTDVPEKFDQTIHFFGNCVAVGSRAEDKYTIESFLQRMLNTHEEGTSFGNKVFRVVNRSNWASYGESWPQILDTQFNPGDYIVLISACLFRFKFYYEEDEFVKYIDLSNAFHRPHEYSGEVFFDHYHMNHRGYKLIANELYDIFKNLTAESMITTSDKPAERRKEAASHDASFTVPVNKASKIERQEYEGLDHFLEYLQSEKVSADGIVGSIVMNCNPFTLGHRFLIEESLKHCDFLYIFIVEEDKSYFPFSDRIECVRKGVSDIENVKVLPSGKFIISTLTFPEYFVKEQSKATIDASLDVKLFAGKIAPILDIKKRFVGQEPICQITRQYNMAMREILPQYGIEFIVFERKEVDLTPISASKVRALLEKQQYDELKKFVPESTLHYLLGFKESQEV